MPEECRARSRRHHDAIGRDGDIEPLLVEPRDRLAQPGEAESGRVEHRLLGERACRSANHRLGRREVRFPDLEVDDVVARGLEALGVGEDLHDLERGDAPGAAGEAFE